MMLDELSLINKEIFAILSFRNETKSHKSLFK